MIYLISFIVLLIASVLFKMSAGNFSFNKLNLISIIFYRDFLIFTFIGTVLVVSHFDIEINEYFWGITGHISDKTRYYGWLSVLYTIIIFPIGMILANLIFLKKLNVTKNIQNYYKSKVESLVSLKDSYVFLILCIALFISTLAILYVFFMIGKIPILYLFKGGDALLLGQLRGEAKLNFQGVVAIREVIALNFTLLLSLVIYAYKLLYKKGRFNILFYYSFFLSCFALTYNLEKSPVFYYILALLIVRMLFYGRVGLGRLFIVILCMLIGVGIFLSFFTDGDVFKALLIRIFIAQTVAIFQGFEYFPYIHDFLGVSGISKFFAFLSGEELQNSGRVLFEIYSPVSVKNGTAGYIVGLFNAEAWMLFGLPGLLLAPLYVGFFIQTLHIFLIKQKKTPIFVGLYAYFCIKLSVSGSIAQFFYPSMILSVIVFVWLIFLFARVGKTYFRNL